MENNVDYRTKAIAFQGGLPTILCRKDDSSCPLLALCNSLILLGKFSLNIPPGGTITGDQLIKQMCDLYMKKVPRKGQGTRKAGNRMLRSLAQPMELTSVEWETSQELKLFEQHGIKVYLDRKEEQLAFSLKSLKQDKHSTVCAMFWNNDFHVLFQLHGTLLLLQNCPEHFDTSVVWQHFDDVNGRGFFMDSKFLPVQNPLGATAQQQEDNMYVAKSVEFRGRQKFIIYPSDMTGSSPLLALCNAILLRGDVELS